MAYIGSTPTSQNFISGTDYFNGTGSQTAFTLTRSVNSVNDVEVVVNNVIQQPNSYTVSGTTLTLSAAPSSGTSNVYVRYLSTTQQSITVPANSIDYNKLDSNLQSKFAMKNRIINGAMVIDQRNAGASVTPTSSAYLLDRFACIISQASKFSFQQNAGSVTTPVGFTKYLGATSLSAYSVGAGDFFTIRHCIEGLNVADLGWGTANAKTVTLSFQVRSSLTGTFGGSLLNSAQNRSYPFSYTVSSANTWTTISVTIAGDTSGTWLTDTGIGIQIHFGMGAGSTYSGTAGSWSGSTYYSATGATSVVGTNGATFYITGVQLEVGSSATGYEYRQYQQELALCQRYFEHNATTIPADGSFQDFFKTGTFTAGSLYCSGFPYSVTKRATPTVTFYRSDNSSGNGQWGYYTSGWNNATGTTTSQSNQHGFSVYMNASLTANNCYLVAGIWSASAEL